MALGDLASDANVGEVDADAAILVVDDDEGIRLTLGFALELSNHRVALARDGRDALAWLRRHRSPELILMDLMMPNMDGWQLLEALRHDERLSRIPVVVITAFRHDLGTAASLPVLTKPIDLEGLERTIERYFRRSRER